jgi:hypothetical protein
MSMEVGDPVKIENNAFLSPDSFGQKHFHILEIRGNEVRVGKNENSGSIWIDRRHIVTD